MAENNREENSIKDLLARLRASVSAEVADQIDQNDEKDKTEATIDEDLSYNEEDVADLESDEEIEEDFESEPDEETEEDFKFEKDKDESDREEENTFEDEPQDEEEPPFDLFPEVEKEKEETEEASPEMISELVFPFPKKAVEAQETDLQDETLFFNKPKELASTPLKINKKPTDNIKTPPEIPLIDLPEEKEGETESPLDFSDSITKQAIEEAFGITTESDDFPKTEAVPEKESAKPKPEPPPDPLLQTAKSFHCVANSYDAVSDNRLAYHQLCPEEGQTTVSFENVAVTTFRTLLVRYHRTVTAAILTGFLVFLTACYEGIGMFAQALLSALGLLEVRGAAMLLDFLWLLVALLVFIPKTIRAMNALREKTVTPDFIAFLCAALSALFLLVRTFIGVGTFYAALPAVTLLFTAQLCHLFALSASYGSAQICLDSKNGTTVVLRRARDLPEMYESVEGNERPMAQVMSVKPFIGQGNFLRRLCISYVSDPFNRGVLLLASLTALICAVIFGLSNRFSNIPDSFGVLVLILCACVPISAFLVHSWAHLRLFHVLRNAKMAAAGEGAVYETSRADVLCFADTEAIPSSHVRIVKIKISGDNRLDRIIGYLSALFAKLGGPLDGHFRLSSDEPEPPKGVVLTELAEDGVCAAIDGVYFRVGRGAYMQKNGIPFYYDAEDETQLENGHTSVMFVSINDIGCAKLYLYYDISEKFERMVQRMAKEGVSAFIHTADPNINEHLLGRISYLERNTLGVVRSKLNSDAKKPDSLTDSLIAFGVTPSGIYRTRFLSSAYRRMQTTLPYLTLITAPICALLCLVAAIAGTTALTLLAVGCQLIAVVPTLIIIEAVLHKHQIGDGQENTR